MLKTLAPIVLPLVLLASGLGATAAQADTTPTVRISYADLNLSSKAGVSQLDRRIARAIDQVCASASGAPAGAFDLGQENCRSAKREQIQPARDAAIAKAQGKAGRLASAG